MNWWRPSSHSRLVLLRAWLLPGRLCLRNCTISVHELRLKHVSVLLNFNFQSFKWLFSLIFNFLKDFLLLRFHHVIPPKFWTFLFFSIDYFLNFCITFVDFKDFIFRCDCFAFSIWDSITNFASVFFQLPLLPKVFWRGCCPFLFADTWTTASPGFMAFISICFSSKGGDYNIYWTINIYSLARLNISVSSASKCRASPSSPVW